MIFKVIPGHSEISCWILRNVTEVNSKANEVFYLHLTGVSNAYGHVRNATETNIITSVENQHGDCRICANFV